MRFGGKKHEFYTSQCALRYILSGQALDPKGHQDSGPRQTALGAEAATMPPDLVCRSTQGMPQVAPATRASRKRDLSC